MNPKKDGSLAGYLPPFQEPRLGSTPLPIGLDRTLTARCHVHQAKTEQDGQDSTAVAGDCQISVRARMPAIRNGLEVSPGQVDPGALLIIDNRMAAEFDGQDGGG